MTRGAGAPQQHAGPGREAGLGLRSETPPPTAESTQPARNLEAAVTRRQFLIGGGLVAISAAAAGVIGWRSWTVRGYWYRLIGAYGEPGTPPPSYKVTYQKGTLPSQHVSGPVAYDIAYPPGVESGGAEARAGTPVLFCLPGRGRSPGELLQGHLRFGDYVADGIEKRGVTPFAVAAVQASDTYWHERAAGDDAMAMLFDEFIPFVRDDLGLKGPQAIMGWSMGGYGALRAAELHPQQFYGVCGVSAALWRSYDDGVGDAFDSADDYERNDAYADAGMLAAPQVRLDCGRQDPFYEANRAFAEALPDAPAGGFSPGGHNDDYWSRVAPAEIDWIGSLFAGYPQTRSPGA